MSVIVEKEMLCNMKLSMASERALRVANRLFEISREKKFL